jgi:iron complex outermembrane receptor protein
LISIERALPVMAALTLLATSTQAQTRPDAAQRIEVTGASVPRLDEPAAGTSRLNLSLREQPASVTLVDQQAIEAMGALDTQDILAAVPGVSWSAQPGAAGSVFYRGFGSSSLTQLWNGLSVQYDAIAARPVDAWLVASLEAIGGASGFLYGTGGVGGTINVVTKVADGSGDVTQLRAAAGTTRQLAADLQRRLGADAGHALRLVVNATEGTDASMGEGRKSWQLGASWRLPITPTLTHLLAVEQQWEQVRQPYWGTPLLRDGANAIAGPIRIDPGTVGVNYNVVDGRYEQDVRWLRSLLQWKPSAALGFTHTLYHYDALRDYDNVEVYAFVNANTQVERSSALLQRHDQQVWGSRGELTLQGHVGGLRSDSAFGWDWSFNRQTRFPLSVNGPFDRTDPYAPADTYFLSTPGITRTYTPGATNRLHTGALFAENRTVLGGGWALVSALRADRITLQVTNHRAVTATNPAVFNIDYQPLTGRLGLVKDLSPAWQVYAQFSTAADPPSGILSTAGFAALRDFDLTRGRQLEIGTKASFDQGRGEWRLALYDIVRKNVSVTDPDDRNRVIAVGRQSSRGVEIAGGWALTPAWKLTGHLNFTDARYDHFTETVGSTVVSRAGNTPPNTPDWVAGAEAQWKPAAGWTVSADWRHVGKRYANNANTAWDGAYDLFGAALAWQPDPRLTVRGRVANLADKVYAATVGASTLAYLGAPRTWSLSADWRF